MDAKNLEILSRPHTFEVFVAIDKNVQDPDLVFQKPRSGRLSPGSTKIKQLAEGTVYWFRFGVIAFHNVDSRSRDQFLKEFSHGEWKTWLGESLKLDESSEIAPKVEFEHITLDKMTPERAEFIANLVSQSAALEHYEIAVDKTFTEVQTLVRKLKLKGTISPFPGSLHRFVGRSLEMKNSVISSLHYLDLPDLLWDDSTMDEMYEDLQAFFDIKERFSAIERKLESIQDSLELLLDTARDRRMYWLEAAIVALILFDIIAAIVEKW